jgi:hypothetical protein
MPRKKTDPNWTPKQAEDAAEDGWLLALTIDSGQTHAYYRVYPYGPKHGNQPTKAAKHVLDRARRGSKLHVHALQLMTASRIDPKEKK